MSGRKPLPEGEPPASPAEDPQEAVSPRRGGGRRLGGVFGAGGRREWGEESPPIVTYEEEPEEPDGTNEPQKAKKRKKKKKSRMDRTTWGCIRGIIYAVLVLGISGTLAYFAITGGIDMVGLNKSSALVDVEIPRGASTEQIADILKEKGLIDQPLIFRLYSKLTKADGGYRPGMFTLSANMGYGQHDRRHAVHQAQGYYQGDDSRGLPHDGYRQDHGGEGRLFHGGFLRGGQQERLQQITILSPPPTEAGTANSTPTGSISWRAICSPIPMSFIPTARPIPWCASC